MSTHASPIPAYPASLRELESARGFSERHIGPDADEQAKMLAVVGYGSLAELIEQAVPASIRDEPGRQSAIPAAASEVEVLAELRALAAQNQLLVPMIGLGYYAKQAQESKGRVDELTATLDSQTGALTENTTAWTTKRLSEAGILDLAKKMGISLTDVTGAAMGNADATARASAALDAYGAAAMKASLSP